MTSVPAPTDDRSSVINVRALFGAWLSTSIDAGKLPASVSTSIVPDVERDSIFWSAARPPTAAMLFSATSSAVCAAAGSAQAARHAIVTAVLATIPMVCPFLIPARLLLYRGRPLLYVRTVRGVRRNGSQFRARRYQTENTRRSMFWLAMLVVG